MVITSSYPTLCAIYSYYPLVRVVAPFALRRPKIVNTLALRFVRSPDRTPDGVRESGIASHDRSA